jgi:hypothetical protein
VLVAVAAAAKVFPILFFVFFLRRRDWRALAWGVITMLAATAVSIGVFGWNVHRTYLHEILPWTLHGEAMPPYAPSASISGVLHRLFLSEPQWNPNPWHSSPLCYALLLPALQMLVLAPAILLIPREDNARTRILLEWSALLTASLAISTVPALYNFVLMAFPAIVLAAVLIERRRYGWLSALLIVYFVIGLPSPSGFGNLLYLLRLPLMLALLFGIYALLWRERAARSLPRGWAGYSWAAAMAVAVVFTTVSTLHRERAMRQEFAYRLPLQAMGFLNAGPRAVGGGVRYIAFRSGGYQLIAESNGATPADLAVDHGADDLSFTSGSGDTWVERASNPHSAILEILQPSQVVVEDARDPMLSADGRDLAYVRDDHGRSRLMVRMAFGADSGSDSALSPSSLNVYEASFLRENEYAFSATEHGHPPQIYLKDARHANAPLPLGESRYPAISPDGRWMAYSHFDHGAWNLWLRDETTGATRRIADVPCNQIQPAWEDDSKTLLYSTDCGRSLWFTAVSSRRVIR